MSGKPIWESRFRGLVRSIDSHKQGNDTRLASLTVGAAGTALNTTDYWKEVGKHELLEILERVYGNWERAS